MSDWLEDAWKQGVGGDALKTSELVNRCFTIISVDLKTITDDKGKERETYVGVIQFDNEAEEVEGWLGGSGVKIQIDHILDRDLLPMRVKLVLEGKAYKLVIPAKATSVVATSAKVTRTPLENLEMLFDEAVGQLEQGTVLALVERLGLEPYMAYTAEGDMSLDFSHEKPAMSATIKAINALKTNLGR